MRLKKLFIDSSSGERLSRRIKSRQVPVVILLFLDALLQTPAEHTSYSELSITIDEGGSPALVALHRWRVLMSVVAPPGGSRNAK